MISPEERNKKPYAIPVQCLAYVSLADEAVHGNCNTILKEMTTRNMKVAGKIYMYTRVCLYSVVLFYLSVTVYMLVE